MSNIPTKNFEKNLHYIPLANAAEILGTSRDYVNVLVKRGKLRAVKLGRNWFTNKEWLDEYLRSVGLKNQNKNLEYIPLSKAGKILRTSRDYMNVLVRRSKLRAVKLGRNWVTTHQWLSEYQKAAGRISKDFNISKLQLRAFFTEREKQLQTEALLPEIKLSSRELKFEEKSKILEAVKELFKSADVSEFQKVSKQLGILKSLNNWSYFKFSLASSLVVILLAVSLGIVSGLIDFPSSKFQALSSKFQTQASKFQASIFSDVFKNFPSDLPSFSKWLASGLDKSFTLFKSKSLSELAIETLESGKSKLLKPEEAPYPINTLAEAETLDSLSESARLAEVEGEIPAGGSIVSVGASEFQLLENRLAIVETDLKDQTDLINSELSLQKKTILGALETLFGIARLVPAHPISTIVVQGQPATLTSYSVQPQVNTGFDRLSASYLTLSNNAEINGSLTVKSGGTFDRISVSGATTLIGNATIGGTLTVSGDTTLNNLTLNGTLSLPGSATLGNASSTYLTVSNTAWLNQLKVTGTATTTFNNPISSFSGDFIIAGDSANDILINPYGGNVGIGTTTPNQLLSVWGNGMFFGTLSASSTAYFPSLSVTGNSSLYSASTTYATLPTLWSTNGIITNASSTYLTVSNNLWGDQSAFATSVQSPLIWNSGTLTASTTGANPLIFATNSSERMRIDGNGFVGIATTTVPSGFGFNIATSTYIYGNQFISGGLGVGLATTTSGALQTSGDVFVGRNLYVSGNSTTLGASSADSLTVNSSINSNLIPDQNALRDLGSSAFYWDDAFIDALTVNNISAASTTIAGTQSETFTINSDNNSIDSQNAEIIFYRGTIVPNALFTWNSATSSKRFELNQVLYINNGSASTTNPTFTIKTIANQTANGLQVIDNNSSAYFTVNPIGSNTTILNASSTNFSVSGSTFLSNATTTGLSVNGGTLLGSLSAANSTFTNATSTGGFSVSGGTQLNSLAFTVGTSTSFGVTGGAQFGAINVTNNSNLGNATTTGLTVSGGTLLGSLSFTSATGTSLGITGGAGFGSLSVTNLTNLGNLISGNATTTGLTVSGGALLGSLSALNVSFSNATTTGLTVQGGVSLGSLSAGAATSTSLSVTGGASFGAINVTNNSNLGNATTTGLTVSGGSSLGSLSALNISVSNATTTGLTVSGGSSLGSLSALNVSFSNATTTGLTVQGGTLLGSLSAGAATSTSLSVTGGAQFGALNVTNNSNLGNATTTGLTVNGGSSLGSLSALNTYINGKLGVASTSPSAVLSVNVSNATGNTAALNINSATSSLLFVRSDGLVGIGTTTPGNLLSVHSSGNVYFGGALTVSGQTSLVNASTSILTAPNFFSTTGTITNASTTYATLPTFWSTTGTITNASTTYLTVGNTSWIGTLNLTNALTVANGGTGAATLTGLLQGNGTSAITAVTGTAGQIPYYNGTNTLLATSTIFLSTAGNVGIGTTTPNALLTISGVTTPAVSLTTNTGQSGWRFGIDTADANKFKIASSTSDLTSNTRLTIDGNGNVGIGTTAPLGQLTLGYPSATQSGYKTWNTQAAVLNYYEADSGDSQRRTLDIVSIGNQDASVGGGIIRFITNPTGSNTGVERVRIDRNGNVGIGTTSPGLPLDVRGAQGTPAASGSTQTNGSLRIGATTGNKILDIGIVDAAGPYVWFQAANSNNLVSMHTIVLQPNGDRVGIGRYAPTNTLEVEGAASKTTAGDWLANSDLRIKRDIVSSEGLELLTQLRPVKFRYTDEYRNSHPGIEDRIYHNFIAQDFAYVFPDAVKGSGEFLPDGSEILQLDPHNANIIAIRAIQELDERTKSLGISGQGDAIINQGNVGIGTTNPNQGKVEVKGDTVCVDTNSDDNATSCIAAESDIRLKENITQLSGSLDKLLKLRGVSFDWKVNDPEVLSNYPLISRFASSTHSLGLIAQEVQPILPEAIGLETLGGEAKYLQLEYQRFTPLIIEAIKELNAKVDSIATSTLTASQGTIDLTTLNSDLNMNGFSILNVKSISGMNGLWKIDEGGDIMAQSVETQKLIVGGGAASGVTIYDRTTAAPKCIYIEGGVIKTSDGACGATISSTTVVEALSTTTVVEELATSTEPILTATSTSEIAPASEPVIATSTESVIVSITTVSTATTTP